jgi:hypothetical protein
MCCSVQVIFWNTAPLLAQLASKGERRDGEGGEGDTIPSVKYSLSSAVESSHNGAVTSLMWLPTGVEAARLTGAITQVCTTTHFSVETSRRGARTLRGVGLRTGSLGLLHRLILKSVATPLHRLGRERGSADRKNDA